MFMIMFILDQKCEHKQGTRQNKARKNLLAYLTIKGRDERGSVLK